MTRYEIVTTDEGHHARFIAANGRIVWTTEVYKRREAAENAVSLIAGGEIIGTDEVTDAAGTVYPAQTFVGPQDIDVRYVDERLHPVARPSLPAPGSTA